MPSSSWAAMPQRARWGDGRGASNEALTGRTLPRSATAGMRCASVSAQSGTVEAGPCNGMTIVAIVKGSASASAGRASRQRRRIRGRHENNPCAAGHFAPAKLPYSRPKGLTRGRKLNIFFYNKQ